MSHQTQKYDSDARIFYFEKSPAEPWETGFLEVDQGYAVQGVAFAPIDGRAHFRLDWTPYYPSEATRKSFDQKKFEQALGLVWIKLQLHYRFTHRFVLTGQLEHKQ
jgi:hypothetical protein